jgi:hypothetical protein
VNEDGSFSQTKLSDCFLTLSYQGRNRSIFQNVLFSEYETMNKFQNPSNPKCNILLSELFRIDLYDEYGSGIYKLMAGCPMIKNSSFCQTQQSKYLLTFSPPKTDPVSEMCSFLNII